MPGLSRFGNKKAATATAGGNQHATEVTVPPTAAEGPEATSDVVGVAGGDSFVDGGEGLDGFSNMFDMGGRPGTAMSASDFNCTGGGVGMMSRPGTATSVPQFDPAMMSFGGGEDGRPDTAATTASHFAYSFDDTEGATTAHAMEHQEEGASGAHAAPTLGDAGITSNDGGGPGVLGGGGPAPAAGTNSRVAPGPSAGGGLKFAARRARGAPAQPPAAVEGASVAAPTSTDPSGGATAGGIDASSAPTSHDQQGQRQQSHGAVTTTSITNSTNSKSPSGGLSMFGRKLGGQNTQDRQEQHHAQPVPHQVRRNEEGVAVNDEVSNSAGPSVVHPAPLPPAFQAAPEVERADGGNHLGGASTLSPPRPQEGGEMQGESGGEDAISSASGNLSQTFPPHANDSVGAEVHQVTTANTNNDPSSIRTAQNIRHALPTTNSTTEEMSEAPQPPQTAGQRQEEVYAETPEEERQRSEGQVSGQQDLAGAERQPQPGAPVPPQYQGDGGGATYHLQAGVGNIANVSTTNEVRTSNVVGVGVRLRGQGGGPKAGDAVNAADSSPSEVAQSSVSGGRTHGGTEHNCAEVANNMASVPGKEVGTPIAGGGHQEVTLYRSQGNMVASAGVRHVAGIAVCGHQAAALDQAEVNAEASEGNSDHPNLGDEQGQDQGEAYQSEGNVFASVRKVDRPVLNIHGGQSGDAMHQTGRNAVSIEIGTTSSIVEESSSNNLSANGKTDPAERGGHRRIDRQGILGNSAGTAGTVSSANKENQGVCANSPTAEFSFMKRVSQRLETNGVENREPDNNQNIATDAMREHKIASKEVLAGTPKAPPPPAASSLVQSIKRRVIPNGSRNVTPEPGLPRPNIPNRGAPIHRNTNRPTASRGGGTQLENHQRQGVAPKRAPQTHSQAVSRPAAITPPPPSMLSNSRNAKRMVPSQLVAQQQPGGSKHHSKQQLRGQDQLRDSSPIHGGNGRVVPGCPQVHQCPIEQAQKRVLGGNGLQEVTPGPSRAPGNATSTQPPKMREVIGNEHRNNRDTLDAPFRGEGGSAGMSITGNDPISAGGDVQEPNLRNDNNSSAAEQESHPLKATMDDGNASFDDMLTKFLTNLRDTADLLDGGDIDLLEMEVELADYHAGALQMQAEMMDLVEEADAVLDLQESIVNMGA